MLTLAWEPMACHFGPSLVLTRILGADIGLGFLHHAAHLLLDAGMVALVLNQLSHTVVHHAVTPAETVNNIDYSLSNTAVTLIYPKEA